MVLQNLLGMTDSLELAQAEEKLSKQAAIKIFEQDLLADKAPGTLKTLQFIHDTLFAEVYAFAGQVRQANLAKGGFRFAPVLYLKAALEQIEQMPHQTFDQIVEKYVEMNIAHPFREGNGRSMRIWLDHLLKTQTQQVIDWAQIDKTDYLLAMERSPVKDLEIKTLLRQALTDQTASRSLYLKGLDRSYAYEGYSTYRAEDITPDQDPKT